MLKKYPISPILITADNTESGKTHTTLNLLKALAKKGLKVGAIKPVETGVKKVPEDGNKLYQKCKELNPAFKNISLDDVVPIRFSLPAAPYVAKKTKIDFNKIKTAFNKIQQVSDIVLIESAGGIATPIKRDFFVIDLAKMFDAKVFFIVASKLGAISATLVNLEFLKTREISFIWAINVFDEELFKKINKKFFDDYFNNYYMLPQDIDDIAQTLISK